MTDISRDHGVANLKDWIEKSQSSAEMRRMASGSEEDRRRDASLLIGRYSTGNPAFADILAELVLTDPKKQDKVGCIADALADMLVDVVKDDATTDVDEKVEVAA